MDIVERLCRVLHEEQGTGDADALLHAPYQSSWEVPERRRWQQWEWTVRAMLAEMNRPPIYLPRLTDQIIRAACQGHYKTDNIDGVDMAVGGTNYTFRAAFKRMWRSVRTAGHGPGRSPRRRVPVTLASLVPPTTPPTGGRETEGA